MSESCLFCKIASREIKGDIVFEDDALIAFRDISPQAPVHILVIPKEHVSTLNEVSDSHQMLLGRMILAARNIAQQAEIDESGFRLVMNCNREGGQTVFHIHLHLLGGRQLTHLG
ncbi:MAG: histidine triad nucleotide-binding protein [Pseudomonadota bacterium]